MSNITLNIVEPGSSTPINPVTPNTGLFTNGIGGPEATIIAVSIVTVLAIVAAILYYKKKHSKDNKINNKLNSKENRTTKLAKTTKLTNVLNIINTKKKLSIPLAALALVVSLGTLSALLISANKSNTNAAEGNEDLTLNVSDQELTIEVGDEPVFAVLPVELTVTEATQAGYTLTAYADNTDLVSTTNPDNTIPMITVEEDKLTALTDNTYGLSLVKPTSQDDTTYTAISTDTNNPTTLTDKDYKATEANDKTTIYYGFYITPDTPYGTYERENIKYEAKNNIATVVFDGNGKFYFDGDTAITTNTMSYIPGNREVRYSHTPNVNDEGIQTEGEMYPLDSNETFVYEFDNVDNVYIDVVKTDGDNSCSVDNDDYFSIWAGAYPDYTAKANWGTALSLNGSNGKNIFNNDGKYDGVGVNVKGKAVTIAYTTSNRRVPFCERSGYGYYAKVIGYNPNLTVAGKYESPEPNGTYRFLGWSKDKDATTATYKTIADVERILSLSSGSTVTLYAISEPGFAISYNGNGADSTTNMDNVEQYTTDLTSTAKQVDLLVSNFTKNGYGFVGWSTDQSAWNDLTDDDDTNNPTIYGPNQTITVDPSASTKLALYAVWAPAETDNSGNPVSLQGWQGCSNLTATTYDNGVLTVGKNTITALTDSRDGNIYTVARLADGNCWMTENLRLDNEPELSQQNTNNPSLPLTNNYAEQTASNKLSASSNDWCTTYNAPNCLDQSKLNTDNITFTTVSPIFNQDFTNSIHEDLNDNIYSYGNYYNWYSATAGNGKQETPGGTTVTGDICPTSWQLPIGGETNVNGAIWNLNAKMGSKQYSEEGSKLWRSFPNNFVYSGEWYDFSADYSGRYGNYWLSTAGDNYAAYSFFFSRDYMDPGTNYTDKYHGYSARCVIPV